VNFRIADTFTASPSAHRRTHQLFGPPPARGRVARFDPGVEVAVGDERFVHVGEDVARADGVGLDVVARPLGGHRLRQQLDAALGGGVRRDRRPRGGAGERADVDDLAAAAARDHASRGFAADEEGGGEVGVEHALPVGEREFEHRLAVLDAGVVDEDVDGHAVAVEAFERARHRGFVGNVERCAACIDTFVTQPCNRFVHRGLPAAVDDDLRAGLRQPTREGRADALRRAGDERGAAGEIEQRGGVHRARQPSNGANARSAAAASIAVRLAQSANWSAPIAPTLKYVASGCAR
jgi:hypothetical protein